MGLNENTIKGKWLELKGNIQKAWGKLTHDEVEKAKGDAREIGGIIQQKYGESQAKSSQKLSGALKDFEDKKEETIAEIKKKLKQ
jgi:uncharacterized protein YjbJ (UPF0337 family)